MSILLDYLKSKLSTQWARDKVRCCDCGNTWNCIYPKIPGGEYKLECPKCKKRNSQPIR